MILMQIFGNIIKFDYLLIQEQQSLHNSILRSNQEHREVRNHWLSEKADLEGRMFQLQALNTQYQGTLKKRDKEIDRLQQLLAKTVKDSQTKAASSSMPTKDKQTVRSFSIVFATLPLKKNLSQVIHCFLLCTELKCLSVNVLTEFQCFFISSVCPKGRRSCRCQSDH